MKKGIHPKMNENVKVVHNGKVIMNVLSTEPELHAEIWAGNHPFYTGKETLVDTDNLVEKYKEKASKATTKVVNKRQKRTRRAEKRKESVSGKQITLKDMLKDLK